MCARRVQDPNAQANLIAQAACLSLKFGGGQACEDSCRIVYRLLADDRVEVVAIGPRQKSDQI
jgi:hypothetical protein